MRLLFCVEVPHRFASGVRGLIFQSKHRGTDANINRVNKKK